MKSKTTALLLGILCIALVAGALTIAKNIVSTPSKQEKKETAGIPPWKEEYTRPGETSRKLGMKHGKSVIVSVSAPKDLEWHLCVRDPINGKEIDNGWEPAPDAIEVPWNLVWVEFRSKSSNLRIRTKIDE